MSEEQLTKSQTEKSSHHHHHHHHHHRSGSSHSSRYYYSHNHSSRIVSAINRFADKLTPKNFSSTTQIKRIATSTLAAKNNSFTVVLGRILFILIFLGVICYSAGYVLFGEDDSAIFKAQDTPSENSQLKIQLIQLEIELEQTESELAKYKAKYGELIEDKPDAEIQGN